MYAAADQSLLRADRRKKAVAVHSLAVDPMRPHSFITGGGDHFGTRHPTIACSDTAQAVAVWSLGGASLACKASRKHHIITIASMVL